MQVNSAQDYLTGLKRQIIAKTILVAPTAPQSKHNYIYLSQVANGQSQYEKTPYPQGLSLAPGSAAGGRTTINLCCSIPRSISVAPLYGFTTFTFTPGAATGRLGPTLGQIQTAYSATSWTQNTAYLNMTTQGYQLWTVPATGSYTVTCAGARGGGAIDANGFGIIVRTTLSLVQGQKIQLLVGQSGVVAPGTFASGGGGSFVASGLTPSTGVCLVAAGGGGGGNFFATSTARNAVIGQTGVTGASSGAVGGSAGSGGGAINNSGAGGAGFEGDGVAANVTIGGGFSFWNNGLGGIDTANSINGGFGGGGASSTSASNPGGGGYSGGGGGGGGGVGAGGGGGASFPAGATSLGLNNTVSPYAGYITITAI
jgi:hypothetical protein